MNHQKVVFPNREGDVLSGYLDTPIDGKPVAYILFAHCFTCNKNLSAINNISRSLTLKGFGVLRFDFTGLGESEGDFSDTNFSSNVDDILSASEFLKENYQSPKVLIGHSLGGTAALMAAGEIPSVSAVSVIAAPAGPEHLEKYFTGKIKTIGKKGSAEIMLGGRPFTIKKQFLDDIRKEKVLDNLGEMGKALLILHSPQDKIVGIEHSKKIYEAARHSKSFVSLDDADHLLSDREDSSYAGQVIAAWSANYLKISKEERNPLKSDMQIAARLGREHYSTEITAGKHEFISDEPQKEGGQNLGPTPYDLLTAALGACTAITLRMYADQKKWDLEEVVVHVSHQKIHAEDCQDCGDNQGKKLDHMDRQLEIKGTLDDKQRQRLLQIANRCPVHRTLESEISIDTALR